MSYSKVVVCIGSGIAISGLIFCGAYFLLVLGGISVFHPISLMVTAFFVLLFLISRELGLYIEKDELRTFNPRAYKCIYVE